MGGRVDEPIGGECPAKPEPTIWKIPDDVWEIAVEILDVTTQPGTGGMKGFPSKAS